jgi:D-threo-aldose 1-dehydrogenase
MPAMSEARTVRLGYSPVGVSRYGFGTAPLGNLYAPVEEKDADEAINTALAMGLNYIDTAPHYGLGLAEDRLGKILKSYPRDSFVISTKVGRILRSLRPFESIDGQGYVETPKRAREWNFTKNGIKASLESSLERLQIDSVDIVYLHDPDHHENEVYDTGYPAVAELRDQGIVKAIGVGMNQAPMLARFVQQLDLDVILCAGRYTLLDTSAANELFPACIRRGTAVVLGGVFNSGLLADPTPGAPYDYSPAPTQFVERAQNIAAVCAKHCVGLRALALQFPLHHPAVTAILISGVSATQVTDNVHMIKQHIPQSLWADLIRMNLLPPSAIIPIK